MSTGWTDRQKTIWTNRHQLHVWTDRWTDRRTNGQTSQAVAIVGWVVLDFYGRMLVSVATNAATILIAHRAPPTPPMPSSLPHEVVILVAAGYQWQQCATSANSTLTSHSSNLAMPIMRNFCYLLSQTVRPTVGRLDRIGSDRSMALLHCPVTWLFLVFQVVFICECLWFTAVHCP